MWDYNIGIVRLASLFRLCGFNKASTFTRQRDQHGTDTDYAVKTGPAQTFAKNPGLLEITPNITGGAVPAQGKASDAQQDAEQTWRLTRVARLLVPL
jgi:hypothetical protein